MCSWKTAALLSAAIASGWMRAASADSPLDPAAVADQVKFTLFTALHPSPDGAFVAYTVKNPQRTLEVHSETQTFTETGFPLAEGYNPTELQVLETTSGRVIPMRSDQGSSWGGTWSPDGKLLAFYSDEGGAARLWVWDRGTRRARRVSDAVAHPYEFTQLPEWSPDGKKLLIKLLPVDVKLRDLPVWSTGSASDTARPGERDAKHPLSVRVLRFDPKAADTAATPQSQDRSIYRARSLADLALIDVRSGAVARVVTKQAPAWYSFSPDGRYIAYTDLLRQIPEREAKVYRLVIYAIEEARPVFDTQIVGGHTNQYGRSVSWAPDSRRLAFTGEGPDGTKECHVISVAEKTDVIVSDDLVRVGGDFGQWPALWDRTGRNLYLLVRGEGGLWRVAADGSGGQEALKFPDRSIEDILRSDDRNTYWSPDGGVTMALWAFGNEGDGLYTLDLNAGRLSARLERRQRIGLRATTSRDPAHIFYQATDDTHPTDVWVARADLTGAQQLSHLNPKLEATALASERRLEWRSLDGEPLAGSLLVPSGCGAGKRCPLIVFVYGGDTGSSQIGWFGRAPSLNMQVLATRGYAMLYPDIPMHGGQPIADVVSAVLPGVDKAIQIGVADPERLGVMGHSFGGYNAVSLITQTRRFRAAVALSPAATNFFVGYTSLVGADGEVSYYEDVRGQMGMGKSPWDDRQRYIDNSPFFFLDRVTTPVLVERGANEPPLIDGPQLFVALRRLGREVEFVEYPGEGHVLERRDDIVDLWNRVITFFDRHLGASVPAAPH